MRADIWPIVDPKPGNGVGPSFVNHHVKIRSWWPWLGGAGVGALTLAMMGWRAPQPVDPTLVVAQVQALGELRTARATSTFLQRTATSAEAPPEWSWIPGVQRASRALTTNEALLSVRSEVDAYVDLSRAKGEVRGRTLHLLLPPAQISRPLVEGKLETVKQGLIWKDPDITLDALRSARSRAKAAADEMRLTDQAEVEAVAVLGRILAELGQKEAKICFLRGSGAWEDCREVNKTPQ